MDRVVVGAEEEDADEGLIERLLEPTSLVST